MGVRSVIILVSAVVFAVSSASDQAIYAEATRQQTAAIVNGLSLQNTFIGTPVGVNTQSNFVAFRKSFEIANKPAMAILHLFADTRYMLWINGQYVARGPARFDTKGPEVDAIRVTEWMKPGANVIVVLVMSNVSNARMMLHDRGLTARLDVDDKPILITDSTWRWSDKTRYRAADVDWGRVMDRIDASVEDGDWTQRNYDDSAWSAAVPVDGSLWGPLSVRRIPLLRETPIEARFLNEKKLPLTLVAGQQLKFDVGRLVQAYTIVELDADEGSKLSFDYAKIDYIARAGMQSYISSDSIAFAGGTVTVKSGRATIRSLKVVERLYPFERVGSFQSSDPFLNNLWAVCARSLEIMSEDAYVDCADRERAEWMDNDPPAFDVTRTVMAGPGADGKPIYADPRLFEEMLRRTSLTSQPQGWVKAHTTSDRFDIHAKMEDRACDWVQGARRYYESTGNPAVIREIWPAIMAQMNYFLAARTERGLVRAREWIVWGNPVGYQTLEGTGLNAFVYKALVDAAYLGRIIGDESNAARYDNAATALASAINRELWDEASGTYFTGYFQPGSGPEKSQFVKKFDWKIDNGKVQPTMHAALWALDQGIVPPERRARVKQFLIANRTERARIMTYYYLFKQLYEADTDAFDQEVLQTLRKFWKGQVDSKWGTTWESFSGGSKAHCYGMFPGYFLSAYVLGVRIDGPVWKKRILIEPRLGDLAFVNGVVVTEFGPVTVQWKRGNATLNFTIAIPEGVSADIHLPASQHDPNLLLDGRLTKAAVEGRYVKIKLTPGTHKGSIDGSE